MKLNEALKAVAQARGRAATRRVFLACGFEPLHLSAFLQAWHAERAPAEVLGVEVGVYGDLAGNLERAAASDATLALVVLEWSDIHPRLGLRSSGAWSGQDAVLLAEAGERLARLRDGLTRLAERMPLVLAPPSLGFPLLGHTTGWQLGNLELELELALGRFVADVARLREARVLHPARLAALSPPAARLDARSELGTGFPYALQHASALAQALVELGYPAPPRKGLITDLDDTLWSGIVGEVGADAVSWSQAQHSQVHGLYQGLLRQLSEAGVLLAIASKNEPDVVEQALARSDLLLDKSSFFPIATSWRPKSEAVGNILRAWNIAADAVVVVDDSPMELEEIRRQHPGIGTLLFTPRDPAQVLALLGQLKDLFGKPVTRAEDKLRLDSLRSAQQFEQAAQGADLDAFLAGLDGTLAFDASRVDSSGRLLELINKTNQFSANGKRVSEGEWMRWLRDDGCLVVGVAYSDRYGALGTIGVVAGRVADATLHVEHWVLSCRAFSRRIEDHTLAFLFEASGAERVSLEYRSTPRNKPFQEFLARLGQEPAPDRTVVVERADLGRVASGLPHRRG